MASASLSSCEGGKIKLSESCARRKASSLGDTPSRLFFFRALKKAFRPYIVRASATRQRGVGAWVELESWKVSNQVSTSKKKGKGMLPLFFKVSPQKARAYF